MADPVNHPSHYNAHPEMECIELVEMLPFCEGNAIKYIWRSGLKGSAVEDLQKALWYVRRAQRSGWWFPRRAGFAETLERACAGFSEELQREAICAIGTGDLSNARFFIAALIRARAPEQEALTP